MGTKLQAETSNQASKDANARKAPFKWEAKVETTRRPSLENVSTDSEVSRSSPVPRKKLTASASKVETVTLPKTSPTRSEKGRLRDLPKSSSFDRQRLLKKDTSVSSTDDDSSSTFENIFESKTKAEKRKRSIGPGGCERIKGLESQNKRGRQRKLKPVEIEEEVISREVVTRELESREVKEKTETVKADIGLEKDVLKNKENKDEKATEEISEKENHSEVDLTKQPIVVKAEEEEEGKDLARDDEDVKREE
ncbi:hypothetical protein BSL78_03579 [Apostichopus japonicus]|uniref:Uncharacterized protein n=1 Tax=Stichopus japonicus TaxID=307972 RepID=A0A2G8LGX6_STIJA|nr:hypothetical protein BSL78_03579 [Apostichopus japonicus]